MYAIKAGSIEKKMGKGVKRGFLKKSVSHADYVRCLTSLQREDQQQHATFAGFRTHLHQVSTMMMSKVGLCCYDNKRYLLDAVNSLSYGHYKIAEMAEPACAAAECE